MSLGTPLRLSTLRTVMVGPFIDSADGITPKTGLTIAQADRQLSKLGGDFAQSSQAGNATDKGGGWYLVTLSAADTGSIGTLQLSIQVAGALPMWVDFRVYREVQFDAWYSDAGLVDAGGEVVNGTTSDEYTAFWELYGQPLSTVPSPTVTLLDGAGAVIMSPKPMTQIAGTTIFQHSETTNRLVVGVTNIVRYQATINGTVQVREWTTQGYGPLAPTVQEIDAELEANHGAGAWQQGNTVAPDNTQGAAVIAHGGAGDWTTGGGGTSITQQEVRDSMKLAPSAGTPAGGSVDAELDAIGTSTAGLAGAAMRGTDGAATPGAEMKLDAATVQAIVAAVDASVIEPEGGWTREQIERISLAVLAGVTTNGGATFSTPDGVKQRLAAVVNPSNERTSMTPTPDA